MAASLPLGVARGQYYCIPLYSPKGVVGPMKPRCFLTTVAVATGLSPVNMS